MGGGARPASEHPWQRGGQRRQQAKRPHRGGMPRQGGGGSRAAGTSRTWAPYIAAAEEDEHEGRVGQRHDGRAAIASLQQHPAHICS